MNEWRIVSCVCGLAKIKKNGEYNRILNYYLFKEIAEKNKSTEKSFLLNQVGLAEKNINYLEDKNNV